MHVGFFHSPLATPGGAEFLCVTQAQYLRSIGDAVRFVTFVYDASIWGDRLQGIEVTIARYRHWTDGLAMRSRLGKIRRRGARAIRLLAGVDVVLAHNFPASLMLAASDFSRRRVWQCNEPPRLLHLRLANPVLSARVDAVSGPAPDAVTELWRDRLARAKDSPRLAEQAEYDIEQSRRLDCIYAISEFSRGNARRIYGRCAEKVIYPIMRFPARGRSRSGIDTNSFGVLVHSRLEIIKNIDTVVRGFASFRASCAGAHLHVVGGGSAREELERLAAQLLPANAYSFHGYLSDGDLRRVYDACDVFALLPLDEPFGMVYPEAASRGLLLIGPDHGGPAEILDGGRLGWCIDAFSPDAVAEALSNAASLSDVEADRRRTEADNACRDRFGEAVIGPQLRRMIVDGHD